MPSPRQGRLLPPAADGRTLWLSVGYVTEEPGTGIKSRQKSLISLPAS
ncbi:hypothetical protein AB0L26_31095 [Streptomyces nondiastaticus]